MAVARIFSITDKTSGRDRICRFEMEKKKEFSGWLVAISFCIRTHAHCRLVQYGSKLTSWALEAKGFSVELVQKLKDLESTISTARKRALHAGV